MMESKQYPFFGVPPASQPRPAEEVPTLRGKRVILSTPEGFVYDMRAATEVYADSEGRSVVDIVTEEDYFRWMLMGEQPPRASYPTSLVWCL